MTESVSQMRRLASEKKQDQDYYYLRNTKTIAEQKSDLSFVQYSHYS
jgi:hypothetical protein